MEQQAEEATLASIASALEKVNTRLAALEEGRTTQGNSNGPSNTQDTSEGEGDKDNSRGTHQEKDQDTDNTSTHPTDAAARARRRLATLGLADSEEENDSDDDPTDGNRLKPARRGRQAVSGKDLTAESRVMVNIDWPHFYVLTDKGGIRYEQLSIAQFAQGFIAMIKNATPALRPRLLDHLELLMKDAAKYRWPLVRSFHQNVATLIEQQRITWDDIHEIKERRQEDVCNAESPLLPKKPRVGPADHTSPAGPANPCPDYQQKKCEHRGSHGQSHHICAYCYETRDSRFPHPILTCRKRQADEAAKNGPQPDQ